MAPQKAAPIGQAATLARIWREWSEPITTVNAANSGSSGTSSAADINASCSQNAKANQHAR
jgi:hypothetical protein